MAYIPEQINCTAFAAWKDFLSSRLYCRLRNRTESYLAARGLYHRWRISLRPENPVRLPSVYAPLRRMSSAPRKKCAGPEEGTV